MGSALSIKTCFILNGRKVSRAKIEIIQEIVISQACSQTISNGPFEMI